MAICHMARAYDNKDDFHIIGKMSCLSIFLTYKNTFIFRQIYFNLYVVGTKSWPGVSAVSTNTKLSKDMVIVFLLSRHPLWLQPYRVDSKVRYRSRAGLGQRYEESWRNIKGCQSVVFIVFSRHPRGSGA